MSIGRNLHVFVSNGTSYRDGWETPSAAYVGSANALHEALELAAVNGEPGEHFEILAFNGGELYLHSEGEIRLHGKKAFVA